MSNRHAKLSLDALARIDAICESFEQALRQEQAESIETVLRGVAQGDERKSLLTELLTLEIDYRMRHGDQPKFVEYEERFPDSQELVRIAWDACTPSDPNPTTPRQGDHSRTHRSPGVPQTLGMGTPTPSLGRYILLEKLGMGGCATVYRAYDQSLHRDVAVKVPHEHRAAHYDLENYLNEARMVAKLDHPAIVPVYDVGRAESGTHFVVSRLVQGQDLSRALRQWKPTLEEAVAIVSRVAEALEYAHERGVVHRDLKPSNILLDLQRRAYVTDFGLAAEMDLPPDEEGFIGTPAYMSPEQAAGESHLIDHRSDIFSLGVVFYEMLTGRRPFPSSDMTELLESIREGAVVPPRQRNQHIPVAVERVCMRCLAPRISDRYGKAAEFRQEVLAALDSGAALPDSSPKQGINPKGLRSYDEHDAEFFLKLLPGPHDKTGLPESVRFWIQRIAPGAKRPFRLGLLSGTSGVGKSSFVKAGLIPHLPQTVHPIFVEATSDGMDEVALEAVRTACSTVAGSGLVESFAALRRTESDTKYVLFIDQAEQWLQRRDVHQSELTTALRQCDGDRLQAVIMVRDEFAMEATRLLYELDVTVEQGVNFAVVSGLPRGHARQVLSGFGQALGRLPPSMDDATASQEEFLDQAIAGLADKGRVVPVQLAMLTEIVRDRPWLPASLEETGGAEGLAVAYLEMCLGEKVTHPACKLHRNAARKVLGTLLPAEHVNIKGHFRTYAELLEASGYTQTPLLFDELMRLLDRELRLVTPAEVGEHEGGSKSATAYLLAHDFIVSPLRQWLTQKDKETVRGRAELCLAERSSWWQSTKAKRQLPSLPEWLSIHLFAHSRPWTVSEREMMRHANLTYCVRYGLVILAIAAVFGLMRHNAKGRDARNLAQLVVNSKPSDLPGFVDQLRNTTSPVRHELHSRLADSSLSARRRLNILVGLACVDEHWDDEAVASLIEAEDATTFEVACRCLTPRGSDLADRFFAHWQDPESSPGQRFRAACALAQFAPARLESSDGGDELTDFLLTRNLMEVPVWARMLRPLKEQFVPKLERYFRNASDASIKNMATSILGELHKDSAAELVSLAKRCSAQQLAILMPSIRAHRGTVAPTLLEQWREEFHSPPQTWPDVSAATAAVISNCGGAIESTHAYATSLQRGSFDLITAQLELAGYETTSVAEHIQDGEERMAAIWRRRPTTPPVFTRGGLASAQPELKRLVLDETRPGLRQLVYLFSGKTRRAFDDQFYITDIRYHAAENEATRLFDVYWMNSSHWKTDERPSLACRDNSGRIDFPPVPFHEFSAFTVEAWVSNWSGGIICQGVQQRGAALWLGIGDGAQPDGTLGWSNAHGEDVCRMSLGKDRLTGWNHVAIVFDGARATAFLNGQVVESQETGPPGMHAVEDGSPQEYYGSKLGYANVDGRGSWSVGDLSCLRISQKARYAAPFEPSTELPFDEDTYLHIGVTRERVSLGAYPDPEDRIVNVPVSRRLYRRARHLLLSGYGGEVHQKLCAELAGLGFGPVWMRNRAEGGVANGSGSDWQSRWTRAIYPPPTMSTVRRLASLATLLTDMGELPAVAPAFALRADNELRSEVIARFATTNCAPLEILSHLKEQTDPGIRQGLLLALSKYGAHVLPGSRRESFFAQLQGTYSQDGDPGEHAAIDLLCRRWNVPLPELEVTPIDSALRRSWSVAPNRHQLATVVPPRPVPNSVQDPSNLPAKFAVGWKPVTISQLRACPEAREWAKTRREASPHPATTLSWHLAARYCNWLSQEAGIPEEEFCFEPVEGSHLAYRITDNYLAKKGFRLPTRAEWRFACGGGVRTNHFHGNNTARLADYCWDASNSDLQAQDVGVKQPNWCGLFDTLGSVREWVVADVLGPRESRSAATCGGDRSQPWTGQFIEQSRSYPRSTGAYQIGFRVARTLEP